MNVAKQLVCISFLVISLAGVSLLLSTASACTGIVLKSQNEDAVYGRTQEWGAFDLNSRLVVVPRGTAFKGHTPDGKPGHQWEAKYGVVAIDAI
jgi:choloylglycine hydrolase